MKSILLHIFFLLLFQPSLSQDLGRIDWNMDIDYLAKELPYKHFDFFTKKSKKEFKDGLENIKKNKDSLSDLAIAIELQQLIASFGDSHTHLNLDRFLEKDKTLPFIGNWFSDGFYVLQTTPEYSDILGKQIVSINGVPFATIVDSLSTLITMDNPSMLKNYLPKFIMSLQLLKNFKFTIEDEIELGIKNTTSV